MRIEELNKTHDRSGFSCREVELNGYLQKIARQHHEGGGSKTFVLIDEKEPTVIVGFFTMTIYSVDLENFPKEWTKKFSKGSAPHALLLGRLAVDKRFENKGYGGTMIIEALKRTQTIVDTRDGKTKYKLETATDEAA